MKCTHKVRQALVDQDMMICGSELDLVGSMSVDPREGLGFVVHDGEPTPSEGQRWAVYLCPHFHETRVLTDGWPP